jgi:hypothetical protein
VLCHRAPREAVASYASLVHTLRRAYSDSVSAAAVGRQALTRTATAMQRALEVRGGAGVVDQRPDGVVDPRPDGDGAFVDVSYRDLVDDPAGAVRRVYDRLGRPFEAGMEERIGQWTAANPQHGHGPHRYDLARFGLTDADVDAAFAPYMERFAAFAGS